MPTTIIRFRLFIFSLAFLGINVANAQYTVLVNFTDDGAYPGAYPVGSLTPSDGLLYGITTTGGTNYDGVIFSFDPVGNVYKDLVNFTGNSGAKPGQNSQGTLVRSGDVLYGVTAEGGALGLGVIFSYDPVTNIYTDLVNFDDTMSDYPVGQLVLSGGLLYGITDGGNVNFGSIFAYDPVGNIYTNLVNFTGTGGSKPGANPYGSLTLSGDTFYGMTESGGANNRGVIFSYKPVGNIYKELISFTDTSGAYPGGAPDGSLTPFGGLLYGLTGSGGTNNRGVIFSYDPVGGVYTVLANFTGVSGTHPGTAPLNSLTLFENVLYGTTWSGGANDDGVIFSYDPASNVYKDLVDFTGIGGACPGENSPCTLTSLGDLLYGMTSRGGAHGEGVIFSFNTFNIGKIDPLITVFPNPNHGLFTLRVLSAVNEPVSTVVTNTVGEKICQLNTLTNTDTQINLTQQPPGIYFITVLIGNQKHTEKIILE